MGFHDVAYLPPGLARPALAIPFKLAFAAAVAFPVLGLIVSVSPPRACSAGDRGRPAPAGDGYGEQHRIVSRGGRAMITIQELDRYRISAMDRAWALREAAGIDGLPETRFEPWVPDWQLIDWSADRPDLAAADAYARDFERIRALSETARCFDPGRLKQTTKEMVGCLARPELLSAASLRARCADSLSEEEQERVRTAHEAQRLSAPRWPWSRRSARIAAFSSSRTFRRPGEEL